MKQNPYYDPDKIYRMKNRDLKRAPKIGGFHYCLNCDRAWVEQGMKCPVCGFVEGKPRNKPKRKQQLF